MSKVLIAGPWAGMTERRAAEAAPVWNDGPLANIGETSAEREGQSFLEPSAELPQSSPTGMLQSTSQDPFTKNKNASHRIGLPAGSVSRLGRYQRTLLFEDNVYRLPNGSEFIPQPPAGTLGSRNHEYALLTNEQYLERKRGSVYVRKDGRIFDYACDHKVVDLEMFDTGFTIHDLERTGRYAPELKSRASGLGKRGRKRPAWKRK